ncbi:M28 family peptidase [Candidatus Ulvibacter alkanivorans]|uniref:M28 family peptidase n=1 Tax=Candidatus Ulvibacter alkanivorans TaxID=2267620 RepID=UPI000DF232CE|nr:M28 family peptidase [Candidatus Ulvibacter alkanivorans]
MRNLIAFISLIIIVSLILYSFSSLMPKKGTPLSTADTEFATERALIPLKEISRSPHYFGSQAHATVRNFLVEELENLGLQTEIQQGYVHEALYTKVDQGDSTKRYSTGYNLIKPKNIVGRLKGSGNGKALLLLSHYDSAMIPSYGASDAGSGMVTILESLRAYLATGKTPKNDIIVLFSDAEELGLDGASLFVNEHRWAKDVGLVLNFEARGSGGPSNMILETNGGNEKLIDAFIAANPEFPVASSLMYSVYKMLPNDTDSTVFREDGDIDSFFFAFIDDHFDYHTANDNYANLDRNTLQHQGSYLLPLLHYFSQADLANLKSDADHVYVNAPLVKMIHYPFSWIIWMLSIAILLFIALVFFGIKKKKLVGRTIGRGFGAFTLALVVCGLLGFLGWKLLLLLYPQYNEIQHGFTYNGHSYIAFFVFLSLAVTFKIYKRFGRKDLVAGLYIAPLAFWLLINVAVYIILPGAAYFIIPVFFALISLWVLIKYENPSVFLLTFLGAPALFLFSPLIQFFPVGLGLKMLVISCVFTVLTFGLLIPVLASYRWKNILAAVCFIIALIFFISAHFTSDFSEERQKPNSLVYYQNADTGTSYWATYDRMLDDWTQGYIGDAPETAATYIDNSAGSKYNSPYTFATEAPAKNIPSFEIELIQDTVVSGNRSVAFKILPKRNVNRIELYADKEIDFIEFKANDVLPSSNASEALDSAERWHDRLLRYHVIDNEPLTVKYTVSEATPIEFRVLEYSYDLMEHSQFSINKRPKYTMPKPFVITDAVIVQRTFDVDALSRTVNDTLVTNL